MKRMLVAALALLSVAVVARAAGPATNTKAVDIQTVAVGTAIDNMELAGTAKEFDASVTKVYCWIKATTGTPPAKITAIWSADNKKEAEVPLDIKHESTRTWTSKNVWPGQWKVDIADESGNVLATTEFTVHGAAK